MNSMPEVRRGKLKELLHEKEFIRVMEASNGLAGLVVEKTCVDGKEFDAMWISSLCDSAMRGKPDNEVVDFSERIGTIEEILDVTTKPVIFDGDTGGSAEHFVSHIKTLERMGVSAIVIEDKKGLKRNSLQENHTDHILEEPEIFAEKIRKGKAACRTDSFMIFARIESLIAGKDIEEAIWRAQCYVQAGADGIMIHSRREDGEEIFTFLKLFKKSHPQIPVMVVPTTYASVRESELAQHGANVIVYANHFLRSAYRVMQQTARCILEEESCETVSLRYCAPVKEILNLVEGD